MSGVCFGERRNGGKGLKDRPKQSSLAASHVGEQMTCALAFKVKINDLHLTCALAFKIKSNGLFCAVRSFMAKRRGGEGG